MQPQEYTSGPGAKAARVFDSLDKGKVDFLPIEKMERLLDELGEGFHGDELDEQVAKIDPSKMGKLNRSAFVE
jgi:Ca2+-binding EF-hand superfamily protein